MGIEGQHTVSERRPLLSTYTAMTELVYTRRLSISNAKKAWSEKTYVLHLRAQAQSK